MDSKKPQYWDTKKGEIINAIANQGMYWSDALVWNTSLSAQEVEQYVNELIHDGDLYINQEGEYRVRYELYNDYIDYDIDLMIQREEEGRIHVPDVDERTITVWTDAWIQINKSEISLEKEHFFLEGHYLDIFIKYLIAKANETIIVVTPFVDMVTPTKLLIEARKRSKRVVLVTRPPTNDISRWTREKLISSEVSVLYCRGLHAKIILIDDSLAVISSMNFQQRPTAGLSWEAGIVTLDKNTVTEIKNAITKLELDPAK